MYRNHHVTGNKWYASIIHPNGNADYRAGCCCCGGAPHPSGSFLYCEPYLKVFYEAVKEPSKEGFNRHMCHGSYVEGTKKEETTNGGSMSATKIKVKAKKNGKTYEVLVPVANDGGANRITFAFYAADPGGGASGKGWNVLDASGSYWVGIDSPDDIIKMAGKPASKYACRWCQDTGKVKLLNGTAACTECHKGQQ